MCDSLTASAISFKPVKWDKPGNCERLEALFVQAAQEKPDLILATEGALEGYVVMDVVEGRRSAREMWEIAETIDGPAIQRFQNLAAQLNTCLAFGFAERIGEEVYNAAIFIDRRGDICGRYHKSQLAEGTHPDWTFNRIGKRLRAFDTPLGRMGFVICNDRWNPLLVRAVLADGARLLLIPAYGKRGKRHNRAVLARGRENGVPIVEANVGMNLIVPPPGSRLSGRAGGGDGPALREHDGENGTMTTHEKNSLALLIAGPHPGESAMHNDQTAMAQALLTRGLPADHILLLHGRLDRHLVLAALETLRRRMAGWQSGSLLVHVSGHGYFIGESGDSARAGLLLAGTEDVDDDHHLLWKEFFAALDLPPGVRLTLLPDL